MMPSNPNIIKINLTKNNMSFNHKNIDHPLVNYKSMPDEALAQVDSASLQDYSQKYDEYQVEHNQDLEEAKELAGRIETDCRTLFGSYSKQHKYIERAVRSGEALVSAHASKVPSYDSVERAVRKAKEKVDITSLHEVVSSGGVDEITMSQQNEAIGFLLANGYNFGTDFTAHNAYEIAVSLRFDKASRLGDDIPFEAKVDGDYAMCEGCETKKVEFTVNRWVNDQTVRCGCGCIDYKAELEFAPEGGVKVFIAGGE